MFASPLEGLEGSVEGFVEGSVEGSVEGLEGSVEDGPALQLSTSCAIPALMKTEQSCAERFWHTPPTSQATVVTGEGGEGFSEEPEDTSSEEGTSGRLTEPLHDTIKAAAGTISAKISLDKHMEYLLKKDSMKI
jgi:hypothetical protein